MENKVLMVASGFALLGNLCFILKIFLYGFRRLAPHEVFFMITNTIIIGIAITAYIACS